MNVYTENGLFSFKKKQSVCIIEKCFVLYHVSCLKTTCISFCVNASLHSGSADSTPYIEPKRYHLHAVIDYAALPFFLYSHWYKLYCCRKMYFIYVYLMLYFNKILIVFIECNIFLFT